jgi:hypothetical protein
LPFWEGLRSRPTKRKSTASSLLALRYPLPSRVSSTCCRHAARSAKRHPLLWAPVCRIAQSLSRRPVTVSPHPYLLRVSTHSAVMFCDAHGLCEPRLPNTRFGICCQNAGRARCVVAPEPKRPACDPVVQTPARTSQPSGTGIVSIRSQSGSDFSAKTALDPWPRDKKIGFAKRSEISITPGRHWTVPTTNGHPSLLAKPRRRSSKHSSCVSTAPLGAAP